MPALWTLKIKTAPSNGPQFLEHFHPLRKHPTVGETALGTTEDGGAQRRVSKLKTLAKTSNALLTACVRRCVLLRAALVSVSTRQREVLTQKANGRRLSGCRGSLGTTWPGGTAVAVCLGKCGYGKGNSRFKLSQMRTEIGFPGSNNVHDVGEKEVKEE